MEVTVYVLAAFAKTPSGGNLAGVVLGAETMSSSQRQEIAKRVGYSETAFVERSGTADFKVGFFTPTAEVDLCGHATIAAFTLLNLKGITPAGRYRQETKAGVLGVDIGDDGSVFMQQALPVYSEFVDSGKLAEACNIQGEYVARTGLRPQVVSTGLRDIMLPIDTREHLLGLAPDSARMKRLNAATNTVGVHAFTLDVLDGHSTAHCRNFAPLYGIDEEAATGTSNGALACYLWLNRRISREHTGDLVFEQGYTLSRPSEVRVRLATSGDEVTGVLVGGRAVFLDEVTVRL